LRLKSLITQNGLVDQIHGIWRSIHLIPPDWMDSSIHPCSALTEASLHEGEHRRLAQIAQNRSAIDKGPDDEYLDASDWLGDNVCRC
jgi:hypothetical protein